LILEKAWAKVFGSYGRIEGGYSAISLRALSGCSARPYIHDEFKDKDAFWKLIRYADLQKFPICTAVAS